MNFPKDIAIAVRQADTSAVDRVFAFRIQELREQLERETTELETAALRANIRLLRSLLKLKEHADTILSKGENNS